MRAFKIETPHNKQTTYMTDYMKILQSLQFAPENEKMIITPFETTVAEYNELIKTIEKR